MAETPAAQVGDEPVATYWMTVLAVVVLFAGLLTVTVAKAGAAAKQKKRPKTIRRRMPETVFIILFCVMGVRVAGRSEGGDDDLPNSIDRSQHELQAVLNYPSPLR
jgi:hypothetical protein